MNKLALVLFFIFSLVLGSWWGTNEAAASTFVEEYTGWQGVREGSAYNFGFDFWYQNYYVGTNSNLKLTSDAKGATDPWISASLYIDLWSTDSAPENVGIKVFAYEESRGIRQEILLDSIAGNLGGLFNYSHDFTTEQLSIFEEWGWGNVKIAAIRECDGIWNDFGIKKVGMSVETAPVPEPATLVLLGSGLVGLVIYRRKKAAK